MSDELSDERRFQPRVLVNDEFAAIDAYLYEYVSNLSRGGIFLRCDEVLPVGTEVDLRFTVLVDDLAIVEGRGEVVHHGHGDTNGLGIRFLELTAESQAVIDELYRRNQLADEI